MWSNCRVGLPRLKGPPCCREIGEVERYSLLNLGGSWEIEVEKGGWFTVEICLARGAENEDAGTKYDQSLTFPTCSSAHIVPVEGGFS